jgi:hypothetical protein
MSVSDRPHRLRFARRVLRETGEHFVRVHLYIPWWLRKLLLEEAP